ncbi:hypothetical protein BN10_530019 [Phycicoccus elongatus Lp2]|uniref:Uncharacterized protein n=1 Tax=Phycicoccus elongatus Lp2 TaxID=1193181 RepID=N0DZY2_9MICO|nr:hypothetical protein BN10_530019 [Phycicoccus elongatus Lp2]
MKVAAGRASHLACWEELSRLREPWKVLFVITTMSTSESARMFVALAYEPCKKISTL